MKPSENWSLYCVDPTKIEGYDRAVNDKSDTVYHSHHRLEIDLHLSREELIEWGLYYNRQPAELLILTAREHLQLHAKADGKNTYDTDEEAKKASLEQCKQWQRDNADRHNVTNRKWKKENSEKVRDINRQWNKVNSEKVRDISRQWNKVNSEKVNAYSRKWRQKNLEKSKRIAKVGNWIRKHPDSTNFPDTWNQEDIDYFYKRVALKA